MRCTSKSDGQDSGTVWNPPLGIVWDNKTRSYSAAVRQFLLQDITQITELNMQAYYAPNAARPNLHVVTSAQVAKIELSSKPDSSGNVVATGVTYISGNQTYTAAVTKEVIVSAGSIQSPHVLELSGIGNKTLLESVGIQSRVDLPAVGENFVDHFLNWQVFTVPNTIETLDVLNDPVKNATVFAQ
jgi:choline dehydrogenase-like flavoprotein